MSASETGGSVERVRAALLQAGHLDTITQFPAGTRTAADAAAAPAEPELIRKTKEGDEEGAEGEGAAAPAAEKKK